MCGIAAIVSCESDPAPVSVEELRRIRDSMQARGPDAAGEWIDDAGTVALGHRRLSIIDLSESGRQPMASADGSLVVVFNGEIYNYRELRRQLEARGCRFKSSSDTEVLLHLYAQHGREMVHQLRGMYAFAIWDARRQGLFLARDPFGIKPLYYADDGKTFRVASQVKALMAGGGINPEPEPAGHVSFFLWGYIPDPFTLYRGVRSVPAGTSLWMDRAGARTLHQFCDVVQILAQAESASTPSTAAKSLGCLHEALVDSVRHHLVADVPVGVFLSAGLDSTTLAALAMKQEGRLRTVTLGFEDFKNKPEDETALAEKFARQLGTEHQTVWIGRSDFEEHSDRILEAMDQPSIDGVNTYFVSLAAVRASLKVALSGLGGDELFGGYPSFRGVPRLVNAMRPLQNFSALGRGFRVLTNPILKRFTSPKYAGLLEYGGSFAGAYVLRRGMFMPWELAEFLDPDLVREGWNDLQPLLRLEESVLPLHTDRLKMTSLETCWYMRNQLLRDSDWASMAHSLELRVPLVDVELFRRVSPLLAADFPPGKKEMALASMCSLPPEMLQRRKTGFVTPIRQWVTQSDRRHQRTRGLRGWAQHVYQQFSPAAGKSF
ncbi:MAG: hypothetical protein QOF48_2835 [Verrucomicrobiota bacterium]|jgi:asparagine synthase (glutamine-hydrolysing)